MKITKHKTAWYYSTGLFTEHTQAIYYPEENQLTVVKLRHLPQILKHLQKELEGTEISLKWYKETTQGVDSG